MPKVKVAPTAFKGFALLVVLGTAYQAMAQDAKTTYQAAHQNSYRKKEKS
jgi:hypothetical protein